MFPYQVSREVLSEEREFKYLEVLFTNEGNIEWESDRWICEVSAIMQELDQTGQF